jgi:hypothetical protein
MSFPTFYADGDAWSDHSRSVHPTLYPHRCTSHSPTLLPTQALDTVRNATQIPISLHNLLYTPGASPSPASYRESPLDANHNASSLLFTDIPYPHARTPVHQWYTLIVGPVLKDAEREHWLEEFVAYGCLGIRRIQQKKTRGSRAWSLCLAFKSRQHLNNVHAVLTSQANLRGLNQFQVTDVVSDMVSYTWLFEPRYIEQAIAHHRSQLDLREMMMRAPLVTPTICLPRACQERPVSHEFERTWWKEHNSNPSTSFKYRFLENPIFPPRVSGGDRSLSPPHANDRIRLMDIVTFDKTWLFNKLALMTVANIPPELRRLEMVMRGHLEPPPRSQVKEFAVYMWPTNGPYDKLIRQIGRWAVEDQGSRVSVERSSTRRADETFGYRNDRWRLVLELDLEAPRYLYM